MPGLSATVGEEIEALRRFGGDKAVQLIRHEPDETIIRIVSGWAERLDAQRAPKRSASAPRPRSTRSCAAHIEDELGRQGRLEQAEGYA